MVNAAWIKESINKSARIFPLDSIDDRGRVLWTGGTGTCFTEELSLQ